MTKTIALPVLAITFLAQTAFADGIKLPGITIDENGIKMPGVVIDDEGISAPGVEIDDDGVRVPGVTVDSDGVSAPGVRIKAGDAGYQQRIRIRESRTPGRYDDEFFAQDGTIRRDNFDGMDLRGYDFSGYTLERVNFSNTDLEGASFNGAILERVKFENANLEGADFSDTVLHRVKFDQSILAGACFIHATMSRTDFTRSDLTDAVWIGVQAERTDFEDSSRGGLITRGPLSCLDYQASEWAPATDRPEVTTAAVIEETLAQGADARVDLTVNFAYDSDQVDGAALAQILEIANALSAPSLAEQRIRVEGHTDGDGDAGYNVDLSYRRAIAVVRMLVDDYRIPSDRLEVKGFGEDRPVATNDNEPGRALNRRVTLVNLGQG